MPLLKKVALPGHLKSASDAIAPPYDSCFVPRGFLFPESRTELAPFREFPLPDPFYPEHEDKNDGYNGDILAGGSDGDDAGADFDSTILQISDLDELLLDVQSLGMQYSLHTQMCLRPDMAYGFPRSWDSSHAMALNVPVFSEELCKWHYPIATMGYNVGNTDAPLDIDTAHNYPQLFGYLPNGDLAVYWEIAEILDSEFPIELEPIRTTVGGSLVLMPGVAERIRLMAPCDGVTDTGITVRGGGNLDTAVSFARQWLGRDPVVLRDATYQFYIIRLPVIHCELDFNSYGNATWGAFGFHSKRLSGFEFKINNNPFVRQSPIFSTEYGNVVMSVKFHDRLRDLVIQSGGEFPVRLFPIQRIP